MIFKVEGEDHTIGSILRDQIFKHEVTFAACTKYHPQDSHLNIIIECEDQDPATILKGCIESAIDDLNEIETYINAHNIQTELLR